MKSPLSTFLWSKPLGLWVVLTIVVMLSDAAIAQTPPAIRVDSDGSVRIDSNTFDIFTGPNQNSSNIPMPAGLIEQVQNRVPQPIRTDQLAPNTSNTQIDVDYINQELRNRAQEGQRGLEGRILESGYTTVEGTLEFTTQFDLEHRVGDHGFSGGIEVTVFRPDGTIEFTDSAFVRGDTVRFGPDGQALPSNDQIIVSYGAGETVELRVLHIPRNSNQPRDSGLYYTVNGELAVEDSTNGGDRDFDDGNFFQQSGGRGEADIRRDFQTTTETVDPFTEVAETPLPPLIRQEQVIEADQVQLEQIVTETDENRQSGQVEIIHSESSRLLHAASVTTDAGEQLIFQRYTATAQARLGSDGARIIGQLSPLADNPAALPTLLLGMLTLDPTVDNNQAGLVATAGITQFLSRTHRDAIDMLGDPIANPNADGPRLLQPTGLVHNTRLVGYVPETLEQTIPGDRLSSVDGVFELPENQAIVIAPPAPERVGAGNAAYTRNVGGLIVEKMDGTAEFIPQWTYQGYATDPIALEPGTARRVIYALVPEQAGQNLQLGQTYALSSLDQGSYRIAEGGFQVISADQYPQNFQPEASDVYGVEDTLPGQNFVTERFNGIQGNHRHIPDGPLIPTFDINYPNKVDARVGNLLSTPATLIPGEPGQSAYFETTIAGSPYLGGALSLGLGNQEDAVTTTTATFLNQRDVLLQQTITNTFITPRTLVDTSTTDTVTTTSVSAQQTGELDFDVAPDGTLTNVNFLLEDPQISTETVIQERPTNVETIIREEPEFLAASETITADPVVLTEQTELINQQVTTDQETFPNVSPLLGELAIGGVLNLGNTPWTPAANTLRAELFTQGTVIGEGNDGAATGWRVEATFNPFGEQQRPAYGIDRAGNVTPIYQTQPVLNGEGQPVVTLLADASGNSIPVDTYQFVLDEAGERIPKTVGTGTPIGPGAYLRLEDIFREDGVTLEGGLTFNF